MNKLSLVANWPKIIAKSQVVWLAVIGALGPELLQAIADNSSFLPWLDDGWKSIIRTVCLIAIPIARVIKQPSISTPAAA